MSSNLTISAGMPRAGSGWYYNLAHDLVVASGGNDAREIRKQYHLQRFLTEVNCNISTLKVLRLAPVFLPAMLGNRYVIKTHAGPTGFSNWLRQRGSISVIYIFRDPRAALLSAYEYGQKAINQNRVNAFSQIKTMDDAGDFMQLYVRIWRSWSSTPGVLLLRYEDLMTDYEVECSRLVDHLQLEIETNKKRQVYDKYRPDRGDSGRKGTHFSKGIADRFRGEFTESQLKRFTEMFGAELSGMGYPV